MAHWQLGHKPEARKWYDRAVQWMKKRKPNDEELRHFRTEAAELLRNPKIKGTGSESSRWLSPLF